MTTRPIGLRAKRRGFATYQSPGEAILLENEGLEGATLQHGVFHQAAIRTGAAGPMLAKSPEYALLAEAPTWQELMSNQGPVMTAWFVLMLLNFLVVWWVIH